MFIHTYSIPDIDDSQNCFLGTNSARFSGPQVNWLHQPEGPSRDFPVDVPIIPSLQYSNHPEAEIFHHSNHVMSVQVCFLTAHKLESSHLSTQQQSLP